MARLFLVPKRVPAVEAGQATPEQSARLLALVFPNYPELKPRYALPPEALTMPSGMTK